MKKAIVFIAHGSRMEGANPFIANVISSLSRTQPIKLAFLEIGSPTVSEALLAYENYSSIHVIPLFLVPGRHVTEDIPRVIKEFTEQHPHCHVTLESFIGKQEKFSEFLSSLVEIYIK